MKKIENSKELSKINLLIGLNLDDMKNQTRKRIKLDKTGKLSELDESRYLKDGI